MCVFHVRYVYTFMASPVPVRLRAARGVRTVRRLARDSEYGNFTLGFLIFKVFKIEEHRYIYSVEARSCSRAPSPPPPLRTAHSEPHHLARQSEAETTLYSTPPMKTIEPVYLP
jgi:hypothetical protein